MANYVVIGAGASGLYPAFRLFTGGKLQLGDTVQVQEPAIDRAGGSTRMNFRRR
jgi:protoporphyrinogen oxidase